VSDYDLAMRLVALLAIAACGRSGFDLTTGDGPGASDGPHDAPGDVSGDAAPVCLASYELCDGFEGPAIDAATWTITSGVTLDTTVAHRGSSSVHFQSTTIAMGQNAHFVMDETKTLLLGDTTFYVRAYVRFASLPASTNGMELIAAEQGGSPASADYLFVHSTDLDLYSQFASQSHRSTMPAPTNTWLCMLWTVHRTTGNTGSIDLAGDPPAMTLANVQTDGSPAISDMVFGIGFSGSNVAVAQPQLDVWLDDLIIDKSPITCTQ
jgi:hypothetical protein